MFLNEINEGTKLGYNREKNGYMKEELAKFLKNIEIKTSTQLSNFKKLSVSLRTTVSANHTRGIRFSRDKAFRDPMFEHFALDYFRDSEVTYCIHKQSTAMVNVVLKLSKVTRSLTDLDYHFISLLDKIKAKLACRKVKHISLNIIVNELPKTRCEFKIIRFNGSYRKVNVKKDNRMDVISFDHADEVMEYYDDIAVSGNTWKMADPAGFESYSEKSRGGFTNINQWLFSNHMDDLRTRTSIIEEAEAKNETK